MTDEPNMQRFGKKTGGPPAILEYIRTIKINDEVKTKPRVQYSSCNRVSILYIFVICIDLNSCSSTSGSHPGLRCFVFNDPTVTYTCFRLSPYKSAAVGAWVSLWCMCGLPLVTEAAVAFTRLHPLIADHITWLGGDG